MHTQGQSELLNKLSSGIALQTEFELLNARLSEKADNLEIAEEQLFRLYAIFQDATFDGESITQIHLTLEIMHLI